jgi:RHS repeat-associated protein
VSTRFTFVGLADQVATEEQKDTSGAYKVSKSYAYGAGGENLSLVDTPVNTTTTKKSYYGVNPHGDVETLTDATTGQTTSTYRYTAYGQADKVGTTGDDAITGNPNQDADVVNPYRFNSKRYDGATGTYDMGFREYNPGLNRFLTRDYYNGALKDLALGADPWNTNRYMFAGGNPITRIELDGHYSIDDEGNRVSSQPPSRPVMPTVTNTRLQNILIDIYHPYDKDVFGDGKAGTALREEFRTGQPIKSDTGFHHRDVADLAMRSRDLIRDNFNEVFKHKKAPLLTADEELILRREFSELWSSMQSGDPNNAVRADLESRGLDGEVDNMIRKIAGDPLLSKETGATFDQSHPKALPKLRSYGGGQFYGRALGALGIAGDLQLAWEAGQIFSGKPPGEDSLTCMIMGCPTVS